VPTTEISGTIDDIYYNEDTIDSGSFGTGLTTAEMTRSDAEENMNLDFEDIWETIDDDYPELRDVGPDN